MRTALYRHFDSSGILLYVGISLSFAHRLRQHRRSSWADQITRCDVEYFNSREEALAAESVAIKTENPLFNIVGRSQGVVALPKKVVSTFAVASFNQPGPPDFVDGFYVDSEDEHQMASWYESLYPYRTFQIIKSGDARLPKCKRIISRTAALLRLQKLNEERLLLLPKFNPQAGVYDMSAT